MQDHEPSLGHGGCALERVGAAAASAFALVALAVTMWPRRFIDFLVQHDGLFGLFTSAHLSAQLRTFSGWLLALAALSLLYGFVGGALARRLPADSASLDDERVPRRGFEVPLLFAITALGIALRGQGLMRDLEYDELFTAYHFVSAPTFWDTVSRFYIFNNHVGFSVLARLSFLVSSGTDWAIRLPAFVLGVASVPLVWWWARRLAGPAVAIAAALTIATNPVLVHYSQTARGYALLAFLAVPSTSLFFDSFWRPTRTRMIWFVIVGAFGVYVHLYGVWLVLTQLFIVSLAVLSSVSGLSTRSLLTARGACRLLLVMPLTLLVSGVLYLPVLSQFLAWLSARSAGEFDASFPLLLVQDWFAGAPPWVVVPGLAMLAIGLGLIARRDPIRGGYMTVLLAAPLGIMWLIVKPQDLYARFFIYWLPFLALALGVALARSADMLRSGRLPARAVGLAGLVAFSLSVVCWSMVAARRPGDVGYRRALAPLAAQSDGMTCVFGPDADILQFYSGSTQPIDSEAAAERFLSSHARFECAYHNLSWSSSEEREIADLFASAATESRSIGPVTVFVR